MYTCPYTEINNAMAGKNSHTLAFLLAGLHKQHVMSLVMNVSTNGCKRTLTHMHIHVHMHTFQNIQTCGSF